MSGRTPAWVDTGGWIALVNAPDPHHVEAARFYRAWRSRGWITSSSVLGETYTWLRYHVRDSRAAARFADTLLQEEAAGLVEIVRPDRELEVRALVLGRRFADVRLSWADLTGFAICQAREIRDVFGFDHHFHLIGCVLAP